MDFPAGHTQEPPAPVAAGVLVIENAAGMSAEDGAALAEAVRLLEYESFPARVTYLLGRGATGVGALIPDATRRIASKAATAAIERAMTVALGSLRPTPKGAEPASARTGLHKSLLAASGAAGGAFGLAALPMELPVSTVLVLRCIADVARAQGENLTEPEAAMACMEVFALGGRAPLDDQMDSAYFALRVVLASSVSEAARHVAQHGVSNRGAPIMVRFLTQIASRFGIVVTQKIAAQSIPVIGALGGGAINYAFADHFTGLARGHFTVRRLERTYGPQAVNEEYARLLALWRANRRDRRTA